MMNDKENKKSKDDANQIESLVNSMKSELFDPEKAEQFRKAEEAANMFYALYVELQRAGFNKQEAYGMIIALCGSK